MDKPECSASNCRERRQRAEPHAYPRRRAYVYVAVGRRHVDVILAEAPFTLRRCLL